MTQSFPQGIAHRHLTNPARHRHANWFALFLLGGILAAALFGLFGGTGDAKSSTSANGVSLSLEGPTKLRNGEFFELRIRARTDRAIAKPVIAVSSSYWRNLTVNTIAPEASEQTYEDGTLLYEYDPLKAGDTLTLKVDGQSNPTLFGGNKGTIALRDGTTVLAQLPVRMKVLP